LQAIVAHPDHCGHCLWAISKTPALKSIEVIEENFYQAYFFIFEE